ncbi:hypothetical protein CQW23_30697 [Capsicum baccatum]|uniref:Lipin/Ned1/Smp2 (LNS2) domain-containing protein n=1 Tax=Capsicum baccatum TaxID=33114 RepID=A0A2G2V9Q6_CAPBA|nr:hypothetical protein CQW23_30697 [Capsicum baccatum]
MAKNVNKAWSHCNPYAWLRVKGLELGIPISIKHIRIAEERCSWGDLLLAQDWVLLNYNFQHTGKRKKPQHRKLRGKQQKKLQLQPESLTTVPSEASKVSRDVTSQPARPISDGQKHSAERNVYHYSGLCSDIKALFPSDKNPFPFYAGFGNRHTDEISNLKVGIPKGIIVAINPKGQTVVNCHVDTRSYASLHSLVTSMFPSIFSCEQLLASSKVCNLLIPRTLLLVETMCILFLFHKGLDGGFDNNEPQYEEVCEIVILPDNVTLPFLSVEFPEKVRFVVDTILLAEGAERKVQLASWTADKKLVSKYAMDIA